MHAVTLQLCRALNHRGRLNCCMRLTSQLTHLLSWSVLLHVDAFNLICVWHKANRTTCQSPDPSGVLRTKVGSILTAASLWLSFLRPRSISTLMRFFTSNSWLLLSRNSAKVCWIWRACSVRRYATAVTMAAPFALPLSDSRKRTSESGTKRRTVLCRRRAYLCRKQKIQDLLNAQI